MKKHGPIITTFKQAKRVISVLVGFTVLLFGALLAIPGIPGPGFLVIIAGLAILGTEFIWAKRLLKKFKDGANNIKNSVFNNKNNKK